MTADGFFSSYSYQQFLRYLKNIRYNCSNEKVLKAASAITKEFSKALVPILTGFWKLPVPILKGQRHDLRMG